MPLYPAAPATIANNTWTISEFMDKPQLVQRRLREISDQRFISDYLLTGRVEASGGAINYQIGEPIYTDRDPGAVAPGTEYPRALAALGTSALANVTKWGQEVPLVDEAIGRQRNAGITVDRVLTKLRNRIISKVDRLTLAVISAAVTQTQAAGVAWANASANPFRDIMRAGAQVENLTDGFSTDTVVVTASLYAELVANDKVISGMARESSNTITASGEVKVIAGHTLVSVPDSRMPAGISALVLDRLQLGSLGYERIPSPEYTGDPANGIESAARRDPNGTDSWLIRGRRPVVPVVQEPSCAVKITGA